MTYSNETPPDPSINYQSSSQFGSAPTQVRLAAIFTLISAGLTVIGVLYMVAMTFFVPYMMTHVPPAPGAAAPTPLPFPAWILSIVYGAIALIAVVAAIIKFMAGMKLLRGGTHAWAWGLAASILGCVELLWCSLGCVLPLAAGIYCIIVLAQANTQEYLRARPTAILPPEDSPFAR